VRHVLLALTLLYTCAVVAHEGHEHSYDHGEDEPDTLHSVVLAQAAVPDGESGTPPYRFRVHSTAADIPPEHWQPLRAAHSGFAVDSRPGYGDAYFMLPDHGILRVSGNLRRVELVEDTPLDLRGLNLHNGTFWLTPGGAPRITWASNMGRRLVTTTMTGRMLGGLDRPNPDVFQDTVLHAYFSDPQNRFVPTDVALAGNTVYITTGYSELDRVVTARLTDAERSEMAWTDLNWGGPGVASGTFDTSHGVTVAPDGRSLWVADRANKRLQQFTFNGAFLGVVNLPADCLPCDVDFLEDYMLVPCLRGANERDGAPILLYRGGRLVSTIMPRSELNRPRFRHTHSAVLRRIGDRLYILALAWNPGDYAVFEQVLEDDPIDPGLGLPGPPGADDEPGVENPQLEPPTVSLPDVDVPEADVPAIEEPLVEEPALEEPSIDPPFIR